MNSMSGEKLKGVLYTGTLPAVLTGTKAGYLHKYKIYGNLSQSGVPTPENPIVPSECGEKTANLFDKDSANIVGGYLDSSGTVVASGGYYQTSDYIKILSSDSYVIHVLGRFPQARRIFVAFYNESKTFLSFAQTETFRIEEMSYAPAIPQNAVYIRFSYIGQNTLNTDVDIMLTSGSTPPSSYIPYGYKLPLTAGSTPVDIYIGDDTLSDVEYVDSGTGKIYRMISGVLTPVDPPAPFPQIPTTANSTTISWAGQGLAPSEFDSIQEWVDIPTYTYTNGAWVADN